MALNFPNSPSDGDIFGEYQYDASLPAWRSIAQYGTLPCGAVIPWASATIPAGWLLCNGAAVSRSTYSSLYAALGGASSPWGQGNGSSTFNVPDLRGRIPVGKNGDGQTFEGLGWTGGVESVALTEAQMPSHTHIQNAHNHVHRQWIFNGAGSSGAHYGFGYSYNTGAANDQGAASGSGEVQYGNFPTTATNQNTGGGQAHTNLQPYAVLNYIIKTTVSVAPSDTELAVRMGEAEATVTAYDGRLATAESRLNSIEQPGRVLQVVSKTDGNAYAAGVSQNVWITWPSSRMNLSITPRSSSSKILVIVNADLGNSSNDAAFRILRNGSPIATGNPPGTGNQLASGVTGMLYASDTNHSRRVVTVNYLDSPNSGSAITYDVQFNSEGGTMFLNRAPAGSYQNGTYMFAAIGASTITLMEVAG